MSTGILEPPRPETGPPTRPPAPPSDENGGGSGGDGEPPRGPRRKPGSVAVLGMWIALIPMLMLFLAFVSAYIVRHGIGGWSPGPVPPVLYLNTALLALSGLALERARTVDRRGGIARPWIWAVLVLGIAFVAGQVEAWLSLRAMGVGMATTPHSSFFYLLTGAHAVHVAGGLVGLAAVASWPARGVRGLGLDTALRVVAIYWHFLFVLWLLLFAVLSIWR